MNSIAKRDAHTLAAQRRLLRHRIDAQRAQFGASLHALRNEGRACDALIAQAASLATHPVTIGIGVGALLIAGPGRLRRILKRGAAFWFAWRRAGAVLPTIARWLH
ncbi:MAG: hypothetical protein ING75_01630 [Rhodocyclaceae bacterium]|nr:hypothetical protein [Rhodocyclaceae bacterium]